MQVPPIGNSASNRFVKNIHIDIFYFWQKYLDIQITLEYLISTITF